LTFRAIGLRHTVGLAWAVVVLLSYIAPLPVAPDETDGSSIFVVLYSFELLWWRSWFRVSINLAAWGAGSLLTAIWLLRIAVRASRHWRARDVAAVWLVTAVTWWSARFWPGPDYFLFPYPNTSPPPTTVVDNLLFMVVFAPHVFMTHWIIPAIAAGLTMLWAMRKLDAWRSPRNVAAQE
jgi:hypothetical protein